MPLVGEADVRAWLAGPLGVSREALDQLDAYVALLRVANTTQNLIAASTAGDGIWARHIADSAQLVPLVANHPGAWLDIGSGAGLPGLIAAIIDPSRQVTLVESRRLRCMFLRECCETLHLSRRVTVLEMPLDRVPPQPYAVISARAFAPLPRLLAESQAFADGDTVWLLPKGRNAAKELSSLAPAWQRLFHVEPSLTDADAAILLGAGVPGTKAPKTKGNDR